MKSMHMGGITVTLVGGRTVMTPAMLACNEQKYGKEPEALKTWVNTWPCMETNSPEVNIPSDVRFAPLTTLWACVSSQTQVTESSTVMEMENWEGSILAPQGITKLEPLAEARRSA